MSSEFLEPKQSENDEKARDAAAPIEAAGEDEVRQETPTLDDPDAVLEKRLSEPVLKGDVGIESAQLWIAAFLVAMAGVIAYSNAFTVPFQADDTRIIQENRAAHSIANLPAAMIDGAPPALTMLTFALNWIVTPNNPVGFHTVNIALHVLNGILVFFLCRRMAKAEAPVAVPLLAGLVFTLHPLATESVNYVLGRASLLAATFTLASALAYLRAVEVPGSIAPRSLGWSLLFAFLAWASDRAGIAAPLLIMLLELARPHPDGVRKSRAGLGALAGLFAAAVVYELAANGTGFAGRSLVSHILTSSLAIVRAMQLTLLPIGLTIDHGLPVVSETWEEAALAKSALVLVVLAAGVVLARIRSGAGVALLWFLLASVAAYLFGDPSDVYTERRSYVALAGVVLALPWIVELAKPYRNGFKNVALAMAAAALILAVVTFRQNDVWRTETGLWAHAREVSPESMKVLKWLAHSEVLDGQRERLLAISLEQQQRRTEAAAAQDRAMARFRQAEDRLNDVINVHGGDVESYRDLGYALRGLSRPDEAIAALMNALRIDTQNQQVSFSIAGLWDMKAFQTLDRFEQAKALDYYRRAEALGPLTDDALVEYGLALGSGNQWDDAIVRLQAGLRNRPDSPVMPRLQEFARYSAMQRQLKQELDTVIAQSPADLDKPEVLAKGARLLMLQGKNLQASYVLASLLEKNPNDLAIWIELGLVRARMKMTDVFVAEFPNPPAVPADSDPAWMQLARLCATEGRWPEAEAYLESEPARAQGIELALATLATFAVDMGQPAIANRFLAQAQQEQPNNPALWLKIADLAIAGNNLAAARNAVARAEQLGADPAAVAERRAKTGTAEPGEETAKPAEEQEFILR